MSGNEQTKKYAGTLEWKVLSFTEDHISRLEDRKFFIPVVRIPDGAGSLQINL